MKYTVVNVLDLQRALSARGFELELDGIGGPRTEDAYVRWAHDSAAFIPQGADGRVALDTRGALALELVKCAHGEWLPLSAPGAKWCPDCGALLAIHASEWRAPRRGGAR